MFTEPSFETKEELQYAINKGDVVTVVQDPDSLLPENGEVRIMVADSWLADVKIKDSKIIAIIRLI